MKKDPEYSSAFTSLGLYYADFVSPPDPIRASKCFQKAFELDSRETVAAQRLADGFAEEREWELVEVIARRTIEGEGGLEAGVKNAKEGDAPANVWAWKAVGVVELVRYATMVLLQDELTLFSKTRTSHRQFKPSRSH